MILDKVYINPDETPHNVGIAQDPSAQGRLMVFTECCNGYLFYSNDPKMWICSECGKTAMPDMGVQTSSVYDLGVGQLTTPVRKAVAEDDLQVWIEKWTGLSPDSLEVAMEPGE